MFKRAGAYLSLSPAERAVLRLIDGLILSALIAGVQAVMPLLNAGIDPSAIPWGSVSHTFIATVLGALAAAGVKYAKAQGDPPLPPLPPAAAANPAAIAAIPAIPATPAVPPVPTVPVGPTVPPIVSPQPASPSASAQA